MSEYNFSFDSKESREVFDQTVEASRRYEVYCQEVMDTFASLEKLDTTSIEDYVGKSGIVLYWEGETLVHAKTCADNTSLKLAGIEKFSYLEVEAEYIADLLNTINLEIKPKFMIDLKGKDKTNFLHLQKLDLVAEGLDIPDEEALLFCADMEIIVLVTGAGTNYVNLGNFVEKLIGCAN